MSGGHGDANAGWPHPSTASAMAARWSRRSVWRDALERAVKRRTGRAKDDPQYLEKIAEKCAHAAAKGEPWATKEIGDRLDGKAPQRAFRSGGSPPFIRRKLLLCDQFPHVLRCGTTAQGNRSRSCGTLGYGRNQIIIWSKKPPAC